MLTALLTRVEVQTLRSVRVTGTLLYAVSVMVSKRSSVTVCVTVIVNAFTTGAAYEFPPRRGGGATI